MHGQPSLRVAPPLSHCARSALDHLPGLPAIDHDGRAPFVRRNARDHATSPPQLPPS
jgi:hypothetical protein